MSGFGRMLLIASIGISLLAACVNAWHRTPWSDEGWFSSASYNLARHGFLGTTVIEPAGSGLTRIDQRTYWVMPLFLIGQAAVLFLLPPTLFSARLFTLVWYPVALWGLFRFLRTLFPAGWAPWLAVGLLACSYHFIDNAAFARPDLACAALGLCALAVYVVLREWSLPLAMLGANACIAASGMMHPNALYHALVFAVVVLWFDRGRLLHAGVLGMAVLPYVVTGALWGLYISRDYAAFYDQLHTNGTNSRWTGTLNPLVILQREVVERYMVAFGLQTRGAATLKAVALVAYLAGVAGCLSSASLRKQPSVRLLLVCCAVYFAAMSIFNQKLSYYLIHILPMYAALLAIWLHELWHEHHRLRPVLAMAVGVLVLLDVGGIFLKSFTRSYRADQLAVVGFVREQARPGDRIAGTAALLYSFDFDRRLKDDLHLGLRGSPQPRIVIVENLYRDAYKAWERERPEDMRRIHDRLQQYDLAYQKAEYEVYIRREEAR
jgi:hypothetical protein